MSTLPRSSSIDYMLRQQEEEWERQRRKQERLQEEQAQRTEEAQAAAQEAEAAAQEVAQKAIEESKAGAEAGAAASQAAAAEAHSSSVKDKGKEENAEASKEPVVKDGKVKIGPTNRPFTEEQSFLLHQRKAVNATRTKTERLGELDKLPVHLEQHREFFEEKHKNGEFIRSALNDWGTDRIDIRFGSIKDNEQAMYFATVLATDSDKHKFFKEYAERTGQSYHVLLSEAEEKLGNRLFSTPQTNMAKVKAYGQGMLGSGQLLDVDGNEINVATASQPQIEQAIKLQPNNKDTIAYYMEFAKARGWKVDKDSLGFMDSADLTLKDYNAAVDDYNKRFTIGYTEENEQAYLEELEYIQTMDWPARVKKQMEAALKRSYEERTERVAPTLEEIQATLEQEDEDKPQTGGLRGFLNDMRDAISGQVELDKLRPLFEGKGKVNKKEEVPLPIQEEPNETAQTGGGRSAIASGGTVSVGGVQAQMSKPIASTGGMPPRDELFPEVDAISSPTMHVELEDQKKAQQAESKTYANNIAYDPNMTDEQALAYWRKGGSLDPRNKEQIEWFTDDPAISGIVNGLNPKDVDWDIGEHSPVKYDTTRFWQYGPTIGKAIGVLNSGALTDDMENSAVLDIGKALETLRTDLADPAKGISVPSDQHPFEYMLTLPEYSGVANSLKAIETAQKDVLRINQENQIEAEAAHRSMIDGYKAEITAGYTTPEKLAIVTNEYPMVDNAVISRDKRNIELKRELSSNYYQNENEGFWAGDSAAAIEFKNMRTLGGDADMFKLAHELEMEHVINDYTSAAYSMGMGLDEYLASAGINDFDSIAEIAYNGMQATGSAYGKDVEAQEAVQTIAKNPVGALKAFGAGAETAITGTNANMMQTAYMAVEPAVYERNVQKLRDTYVPEYGPNAQYMYWQDLMRVSETLSQEQRDELMRNISEVNDIFEVGYVIDDGILETFLRNPADKLQRTYEALSEEAQTLPDGERALFEGSQMLTSTLYGMGLSTAVGTLTGSPMLGAAIAFGAPTFSDSYFSIREKGASKNTARWFAFANAAATTAINTGTTGQQMDIWGDMGMMMLYNKLSSKGGLELYKQIGAIIAKQGVSEGVEELGDFAVELGFDYAGNAVAAYDKGLAPKLSDAVKIFMDNIYETDPLDVFKEGAKNFGAGFLMGGIFTFAGVAKALPSVLKGAKMERRFGSLEMSRKMMDGALPFTEENIGKVYTQVMEDIQDPEFIEWVDSADAMARNQNNMVMAAMSGEGEESRTSAMTEADGAKGYREKETAAQNAFDTANNRWIELRQQVMDGNLDAVPSMTTAQQQMGKAKTALIEYRNAAEKAEKKATEHLRKWMQECGAANSHVMAYRAMRWKSQQMLLARELQAKYEAEEAAAAEAERLDAAAAQEVAYAENAVFGEAPEIDEQFVPEEDEIAAMTDKELDNEIATLGQQIPEAEARIAEVTAQREELGLDDESVNALVDQELTPLSARKDRIIARERSRFNDLYGRMQQALEMDDEDAATELHNEYEGVYTRLNNLGVDADQMILEQYGITNEEIEAAQEQAKKTEEEEKAQAEKAKEEDKQNKLTDSLNRRMQATNDSIEALKPVRQYFAKTKLFVNKSQAADILAAEGLKNIQQFNIRYHTQLTTDEKAGAMPLDGHPFTDINDEAPGVIDANAEPVGEMLRILHAGKDLAAKHEAEKEEARSLREKKKTSRQKRVEAADALVKPIKTQAEAEEANGQLPSAIEVTVAHTAKQQNDILAYKKAVDAEVLQAAQTYRADPNADNVRIPISKVKEREAGDIKGLLGIAVDGYTHAVDRNFFKHVERRHGLYGEHDKSMGELNDVARVGWILENYDTVELAKDSKGNVRKSTGYIDKNGSPEPMLVYTKKLNGSVYVVEAVGENKWKKLWLVSAYIQKNGPVTQSQNQAVTQTPHATSSLGPDVRNANASPATSSVAQGSGAVNTNSGIDAMASSGSVIPVQPAAQQKIRSKKAEASALKSIQNLAKEMKVGLRIKSGQRFQSADARMGKGVLGYYKNGQRNAILRSADAGRLDVAGHEIGHAVQEQIGLKSNQQMINSWQNTFGNTAAYTPDQYDHEAFAEFFWRYLGNRDDAVAFAGDAYVDAFEQALRQKKLYKAVNKARMQVTAFMQSEADTKIRAKMVDAYAAKAQEDNWFNNRIVQFVDDTAAAEGFQDVIRAKTGQKHLSLEDNLRDTVRFNRRAGARAAEIMTTRLVDQNGDEVGESMKDALSDVDGKDFDLFWEWMLAKHSLARDTAKGAKNQVFDEQSISTAEREAFIKKTEREHPEFEKANERFQKWRRLFMDTYLVRNGFLGENGDQLMDMLDTMYPNYVPTYRVKNKRDKAASVGGKVYQMRTATGSTEDIINPFDSYVSMVNSIVQMVADNDSRLKFADLYDRFKTSVPGETGAGVGWFANELTQDMQRVSVSTESMRKKVEKLLDDIGTDPDVITQICDIIGDEKAEYRGTGRVSMKNVITIRTPDGGKRYFEMYDPELYTLLANSNTMNDKGLLDGLASVTRMMSMLTTGSNPIFGLTNAMRDFQASVNYGSWATGYTDGAVKWLGALWDVVKNGKASQEYDALGGGGWTAYDTKTKKGSEQIRGEVFKGYNTSNVGRFGKMVGRTVWKIASFERVNEAIEKASRLAEYKYGQHDLSTTEGRIEAFLASQDVTTDFARRGNGQIARDLKNLIPFFNASMQGVYRTGRQFTAQESDRAKTRFAKNVINSALASALANAVLLKYLDDDEKEEYAWLSDDLKAKHMFIPNFAPDVFGNAALIRIPIEQNPVSYAINAAVSNFIWKGETDNEFIIELGAVADVIMDNLIPVGSTILDPAIAMKSNKNWYGSNIVPSYLESYDETNQYTEETPTAFVDISKGLSELGVKVSPMMLQYMAEQWTGYIGQTLIPALPSEKNDTPVLRGWLDSLVATARKRVTTDPLASNGVVGGVYDSFNELQAVYKAGNSKRDFDIDYLSPSLSNAERRHAISEADDLIHSGGDIYEAKKDITALYDRIDEINDRDSLTDEEKHILVQKVRRDMVEIALDAQEIVNDYNARYKDAGIIKRFIDNIFLN